MSKCRSCDKTISHGTTLCPHCKAPVADPVASTNLEQEVRSLLERGRKIEAVKVFKDETGFSLKQAKDAVDALERGASQPQHTDTDADLDAELLRLLGHGEKLTAVELYKDRTGAGLMEAKQVVEALAARHGMELQATGSCGLLAVSIVAILVGIAVVAGMLMLRQ